MKEKIDEMHQAPQSFEYGSFKTYMLGFLLSLALVLLSYALVMHPIFSASLTLPLVVGLGAIQAIVQLIYFFHLLQERKPRWHLLAFLFTTLIVVMIVLGSLWIMYHLDYNMMPS